MKKVLNVVLKVVFSRTMITFILLLVQICWLLAGFKWLREYSEVTFGFMMLISATVLIYIINKDEVPEFKLAWVIPICIFPVFGALLYLFIMGNWGNIGLKKELDKKIAETEQFLHTKQEVKEKLSKCDRQTANLSSYIENTGGFPTYDSAKVSYFPLGEDKFEDMIKELEKAEKFIFLEYFIIERGRMWNTLLGILKKKAEEGVEVRVMYDGMCSILLLPYSYPKKLQAMGIKAKMFSPIIPLLSTTQNNRDHRKILVIDGKMAYTGGVNLADEYINEVQKFGHWKDVAVKVEGEAVNSFTLMFLQMWNVSEKNTEDYSKYLIENSDRPETQGFVIPYGDGPTTSENVAETIYIDMINSAVDYVHIITPYFIVDNEMLDALQYAARRGVDVKIILPHIPDKKPIFAMSRTFYPDLLSAGVKVYEYTPGFAHAKLFVSDNRKAIVGTINLDYRSLYHHFECAVYIYGNEVVADVEADFMKTVEQCIMADMEYFRKTPAIGRLGGRILRLFAPLM